MTNAKPLAKALHTVTVLVKLAQDVQSRRNATNEEALDAALVILGYAPGCDDKDGCVAKALKLLDAIPNVEPEPIKRILPNRDLHDHIKGRFAAIKAAV